MTRDEALAHLKARYDAAACELGDTDFLLQQARGRVAELQVKRDTLRDLMQMVHAEAKSLREVVRAVSLPDLIAELAGAAKRGAPVVTEAPVAMSAEEIERAHAELRREVFPSPPVESLPPDGAA